MARAETKATISSVWHFLRTLRHRDSLYWQTFHTGTQDGGNNDWFGAAVIFGLRLGLLLFLVYA
jgi:hypothetical protein